MVKAPRPIHSDIRLLLVQLHSTGCWEKKYKTLTREQRPHDGDQGVKHLVPRDHIMAHVGVWGLYKAQAQGFNTGCLDKLTKGGEMQPLLCLQAPFTASYFCPTAQNLHKRVQSVPAGPTAEDKSRFLSALNKRL